MKKMFYLIGALVCSSHFSSAAIVIDKGSRTRSDSSISAVKEYSTYSYKDTHEMREKRRVGVGIAGGGALGLGGITIDINATDENSVLVGVGGSRGFSSIYAGFKKTLYGKYINPYLSIGISRWQNPSGNPDGLDSTFPRFFTNQVLNKEEKESGKFGVSFLIPSVGLQYNELSGVFAGLSVSAELILLIDPLSRSIVPFGGIGAGIYF